MLMLHFLCAALDKSCVNNPNPCRGAKLAEQPHISTAAKDQGGPGQGPDGQAEILLHLQDLPAAKGLALQPLR